MSDSYKTTSTSKVSAKVEDRELSVGKTTRRIIRSELVDNPKNSDACVKITILHQRKKPNDGWEDIESTPLTTMKAGEIMKLGLDSAETLKLLEELQNLYAIHDEKGIPKGEREIVVGFNTEIIKTDPQRAKVIQALLHQGYSEEVWQELVKHEPDLATKLCMFRLHQNRVTAFNEFRDSLTLEKDENYWQKFFEKNTWIFGYGLNYKFLTAVQNQPHYGGTMVSGAGAQKGDFLVASTADVRFTVLVEVKKPNSPLLAREYRNGAFPPGAELSGGIAQVQTNCRKWEMDGARTEENREALAAQNISSVQPKGILIVGHTKQLDNQAKKASFELLRRSLVNPEILTFDELFERARYFVEHDNQAQTENESDEDFF
jgi:hypothetical protein